MLRREPVPGDGRGAFAVLTEPGEGMLRRMWPAYARTIRHGFLDQVGSNRETLRDTLDRVARPQLDD